MYRTALLLVSLVLFVLLPSMAVSAERGTPDPAHPPSSSQSIAASFPLSAADYFTPVAHQNAVPQVAETKGGNPDVFSSPSRHDAENHLQGKKQSEALASENSSHAASETLHVSIKGNDTQIVSSAPQEAFEMPDATQIAHPTDSAAQSAIANSLHLFTVRIRERFEIWLERSSRYMALMREILKEEKLPEELVFLPFVESGFNVNAYSRARAVGAWQFIEATAKRYGLVIDWWRDERKDPVRSTEAAAAYLRDLYKMFGSWNLALAAYNAGEGKIMKALRRSDADDYWSLLRTRQIRDETKNYVPQYYAARLIAYAPEEYGFTRLTYQEPLEFDEVTIEKPLDVEVIAACTDATVKEIRELNPSLRRWSTPLNVDRYTLRIPKGTKDLFFENLARIPDEECLSYDTYTMKKGETVRTVAKKLNIPVSALLELNDLSGLEQLKPGSQIKVPPKDKYFTDLDDRVTAKKVSLGGKQSAKVKKTAKKGLKRDPLSRSRDKVRVKGA
jgi:membrane-bound lytic murein transglycosylase D